MTKNGVKHVLMVKTKSQGLICPKLDSVVVVSMTDLIAIIHHAGVQT